MKFLRFIELYEFDLYINENNDGCVESCDYIVDTNGHMIKVGDYISQYDGIVIDCFVHPESWDAWVVLQSVTSKAFIEVDIGEYKTSGLIKDSTMLSGGHMW